MHNHSIGAYYAPTVSEYTGCIIGIGLRGSDYGWAIEHLGPDPIHYADAFDWCTHYTRNKALTARMQIDNCCLYTDEMPLHTHVQWSHWVLDQFHPGGYIMPNPWDALENPFSSFVTGVLNGYDQVGFKRVWSELNWFLVQPPQPPQDTNTGIFFLPDGVESHDDYIAYLGIGQKSLFQSITHGVVDVVVSPFSQQSAYQDNEGSGVFSVGYEIFRQNPLSEEWESTESDEGNWGYRELFQAEGQIEEPSMWGNIYEALFLDDTYFSNAYIVTNSKALPPSSWANGWSNVYTASGYTNNWIGGICQGAWDTFLAKPEYSGNPISNRQAFFPDGRYAVEVTAVSHGSREEGTMMLPVDDLDNTIPETQGIIVDNFLPSVEAVVVYSYDPAVGPASVDVKYLGKWKEQVSTDYLQETEQLAYLEELREELRFFQALERDENAVPPEWLQDDTNSMRELRPVTAGLNTSLTYPAVDEVVYDETLPEPDDICEVGQDPIEFLTGEIARVEAETGSRGKSRKLFEYGYGYIPYGGTALRDGETLNMLVFYSEPTTVVSELGYPITDAIYMEGKIGYDTVWNSSNSSGVFVRDTPEGNTTHTSFVEAIMG